MIMAWNVSGLSYGPAIMAFAAGLDTLRDRDFALAREELHRAHIAQIQAHRVRGNLGRFQPNALGWRRPLQLDAFTFFALRPCLQP